MTNFYSTLSQYYDFLFPHEPVVSAFVGNLVKELPVRGRALDIGCGTGGLSFDLERHFSKVIGIDLDEAMVQKAQKNALDRNSNVEFLALDMTHISNKFQGQTFDLITCFGNTLVHLDNLETIKTFLASVKSLLSENGAFICQIINFDHILDHHVTELPLLQSPHVFFRRFYSYDVPSNRIRFSTEIEDIVLSKKFNNEVILYPLRKKEIVEMMDVVGLKSCRFFGRFDGSPLQENDLVLIVEGRNQ